MQIWTDVLRPANNHEVCSRRHSRAGSNNGTHGAQRRPGDGRKRSRAQQCRRHRHAIGTAVCHRFRALSTVTIISRWLHTMPWLSRSQPVRARPAARVRATAVVGPEIGRHTITAIALDAGFDDLSCFDRMFRRRFACSPSELRAGRTRIWVGRRT